MSASHNLRGLDPRSLLKFFRWSGWSLNQVFLLPLVCSLQSAFYPQSALNPGLRSAVWNLQSALTLTDIKSKKLTIQKLELTIWKIKIDLIKRKSWPHKNSSWSHKKYKINRIKSRTDHIKSKVGHINTKGIMTGLVPHICGHKNEMILNDLSLDAQFQTSNMEKYWTTFLFNTPVSVRKAKQVMKENGRPGERISGTDTVIQ